jgi:hypothetical protein
LGDNTENFFLGYDPLSLQRVIKMSIKEKLPLLNSKSKITRIAGYVVYIFVGLFVLAAILPSPDTGGETAKKATTTTSTTTSAASDVEDDTGVLTEAAVRSLLPSGERRDAISGSISSGVVVITREMKENLTPGMMLNGARIDSIDIFENLFKDSRVQKVTVISTVELVDQYGQTSRGKGTEYTITRETANKVNWDNLLFENLDKIADGYYIHPTFL